MTEFQLRQLAREYGKLHCAQIILNSVYDLKDLGLADMGCSLQAVKDSLAAVAEKLYEIAFAKVERK